jgi:hypothetical protein
MKLNIKFDLDGCLVDLMSHMENIVRNSYNSKVVETGNFHFNTDPVLTNRQMAEAFHKCYKEFRLTPIYEGAEELMAKLYSRSQQPIHIVTARPISCAHHTHMLVERFTKNVPFTISFANTPFHKLDYLNGTEFFVEDRKSIAKDVANIGKMVFVPIRPWNENMVQNSKIIWIKGVHELIGYVDWFIKEDKPRKDT